MRVACVMMQKDEDLLLDAWCKYYAYMFGYENLYILDNGSTNESVIKTLERYARLGCRVITKFNSSADFSNKGAIVSGIFKMLDGMYDYDIMLPLDCDEFLCVRSGTQFSCARSDILQEMETHRRSADTLKISTELRNGRSFPDYFYPLPCNKTAFARGAVQDLDHGYHTAATVTGRFRATHLCHIHLHDKPYERLVADARRKLAALGVDVSDLEAIARADHSYHLKDYLLKSRQEINRMASDRCHVAIPEFRERLNDLGADVSFAWDCASDDKPILVPDAAFDVNRYLRAYADVCGADLDGHLHYLYYGAQEGRWPPP